MRTSKFLYSIIFILFAFCQVNTYSQVNRFGFRAAVLSTDWESEKSIDSILTYSNKIGYSVGAYFVKEFSDKWNLEYGINVSWKGFKMNGSIVLPGVALALDLINHSIYLDIPIAMRYTFGNYGPKGLFVSGGVQFSYLVFNKIEGKLQYNGTNQYGDPDNNADELNRFDFSIFPSVGYQFDNGLNFQFSYERGLINTIKDDDEYLGLTKALNSVFKLQIGLDL